MRNSMRLLKAPFLVSLWSLPLLPLAVNAGAHPKGYQRFSQGWTAEVRGKAYHQRAGSEIMPLKWLSALEMDVWGTRLLDILPSLGFLQDDSHLVLNPHRLPIGFAVIDDEETAHLYGDKTWVGVNCMACHTAALNIHGQRFLVEGSGGQVDFIKFHYAVQDAVGETLKSPWMFERFRRRMGDSNSEELRAYLGKFKRDFDKVVAGTYLDAYGRRYSFGPSLIDAQNGGTNFAAGCSANELTDSQLAALVYRPDNCQVLSAPVSIPHIWGTNSFDGTQYHGNVGNITGRNVGSMIQALSNTRIVKRPEGGIQFRSSADLRALHALEVWMKQLKAPTWKELEAKGVLRPIRLESANRGKALYEQNCLGCHAVAPELTPFNEYGVSAWKMTRIPVEEVGTDPQTFSTDSDFTRTLPELFVPAFKQAYGEDSVRPGNKVSGLNFREFFVGAVIRDELKRQNVSPLETLVMFGCRSPENPPLPNNVYKARPLDGIAFTAPFLHNGSVPTLWDLLQAPEDRPRLFYTGCEDFDPRKLGSACTRYSRNSFLYDTRKFGHSNQGHDYGTQLTNHEKLDLLEYIKTIESPAPAPILPQSPCYAAGEIH